MLLEGVQLEVSVCFGLVWYILWVLWCLALQSCIWNWETFPAVFCHLFPRPPLGSVQWGGTKHWDGEGADWLQVSAMPFHGWEAAHHVSRSGGGFVALT